MKKIKLISEIINVYRRRGMLINYNKIFLMPKFEAGYLDIEEVSRRYRASASGATIKTLEKQTPVKEAMYFISHNFNINDRTLKKGKILDVGCGNGLYSMIFGDKKSPLRNLEYWGSEICDQFVEICKEFNPNKKFIKSYAQKINSKDNFFDIVYCSSTLHYTLKGWKESIREMSRVCKKYLLFTRLPVTKYNNSFYVHQTVKTLSSTENHFFIVLNRDELEKEFMLNGLEIVDRDYSMEEYPIKGVDEKIILIQYLLKKE